MVRGLVQSVQASGKRGRGKEDVSCFYCQYDILRQSLSASGMVSHVAFSPRHTTPLPFPCNALLESPWQEVRPSLPLDVSQPSWYEREQIHRRS